MGKIVKLKNANDVYTYPVTKTEAVYLEDNKTTLKDYLDAMAITKTVGPAQTITFDDGADNVPIKSLILNIEPHQEGTGDPSPSNIRPISGYNDVTVTRVGKNLLPSNGETSKTANGITFTLNTDGTITAVGTATTTNRSTFEAGYVTLPAGTYIVSGCPAGGTDTTYRIRIGEDSYTGTALGADTGNGLTLTLTETTSVYLRIYVQPPSGEVNFTFKPMIRLADKSAEYEPYTTQTYQITIPSAAGTVYGGTLDATTGALTVTHTNIRLTSTNQTWTATKDVGTGLRYYAIIAPAIDANATDILCSNAVYSAGNEGNWGTYNLYNGRFAIKNNDGGAGFTSLADFKTWLDSQDFQICYPLATPQTYQLTPTEMTTLLGYNTIWMDADGALQATYKADLATYIANAISSSNS